MEFRRENVLDLDVRSAVTLIHLVTYTPEYIDNLTITDTFDEVYIYDTSK